MIVCGFPGVGKSSFCTENKNAIDLESSVFTARGRDDWSKLYVDVASMLDSKDRVIFCSTHSDVINELEKRGNFFVIVCPSPLLEDTWLRRLALRYVLDPSDKNLRAFVRCRDNYEKDIAALLSRRNVRVIEHESYSLSDIISEDFGRALKSKPMDRSNDAEDVEYTQIRSDRDIVKQLKTFDSEMASNDVSRIINFAQIHGDVIVTKVLRRNTTSVIGVTDNDNVLSVLRDAGFND